MYIHDVKSSNIAAVGYDTASKTLLVQFSNGGEYEYTGVPTQAYLDLISAESKGKHLNEYIKGQYDFRKLEPEDPPDGERQ